MAYSILSNTVVAAGGRVLNSGLGIMVTALITRQLGPGSFGNYSLVLSYGALVVLLADFGLYLTLTRDIAVSPEREAEMLTHVMSLRLILIVGSVLLGLIIAAYVPSLATWLPVVLIVGLGLLFQSLSQLLMGFYQKYATVWRASVGDTLGRLVQIVVIVGLGFYAATVASMAWAFTAGAAASFVAHRLLLPIKHRYRPTVQWTIWRQLVRKSWPLGAMLLLNAIYFRIDAVILSLYRASAEVGLYGLAYRVVESGLFFPAMFGGLLLPALAAAWQKKEHARCRQLLTEALSVSLVVTALGVLVVALTSDRLVVLIAGGSFAPAGSLLAVLGVALGIMFFGNIFGFALVAFERQHVLLKLYVVLAAGNAALNFVFIPMGGALAAAWITVLTELVAMVAAGAVVWRLVRYRISWTLVSKVSVATISTGLIIILATNLPVIPQLCLATAWYAGSSVMLGTLSRRHLKLLVARP